MIVSLIHGTTPKIQGRLRDICIESKFTRFYRKSTERQQNFYKKPTKSLKKLYRVYKKSTERQQRVYRKSKKTFRKSTKTFRKSTESLQKSNREPTEK